ncbi:D-arabinono-1,4-lactone oxidase [Archangium lansingense]|uniref:FAD-binding protein n=1 Tax=Archangium lansingense TaxID=2995310 RepID=A0ABT4AJT4_9BACT|nr:D-arabinono-1,4-lactone oxidase [Archangium lansinium]MCY1081959.1 FAD-binding protein [Archangium lansinium]
MPGRASSVPAIEDWSGVASFEPSLYFKPQDQEELEGFLQLIAQGLFKGKRIRVPGGLHSCARILESDAILDTSAMPLELEFSDNDTKVTVSSNWKLHDFLLELSKRNKSLEATGGTDAQTLAGLLTTNTAPASSKYAIFDLLEWVEYVTYDANDYVVVKRVTKGQPEFSSVVCSLGALGIITKMQFSLIDEPFFKTTQEIVPLNDVLDDVDATSKLYDFWRIDWLPDMDVGLLWTATKISSSEAVPNGDYPPDQAVNVLQFVFNFWDLFSGGASGPLLGPFEKLVYGLMASIYVTQDAAGPLRNMIPVDRRVPLRVAMAELSFDPKDLPNVRNLCKAYFKAHGWPNLPIEIGLTKTDGYHMSPWNWPGLDYVVKFNFMYLTDVCTTQEERDGIDEHLQGLWKHLTDAQVQFKAHWGKINAMDHDFVHQNYPGCEQFKQLTHPLFMNPYLDDRLHP